MAPKRRRMNVDAHRRSYDVIFTSCARWVLSLIKQAFLLFLSQSYDIKRLSADILDLSPL